MTDWGKVASDFWSGRPHPMAPNLTQGEYPVAVKLATAAKFGGHASAAEAELFWQEFKPLGMAPDEFLHALDRLAPLSFTYHGRPPSMSEIAQLKDEAPKAVRAYYADLPDKQHPHVSAGDMVATLQSAEPHARQYLGRPPVKNEAAYLFHAKESPITYYQRISKEGMDGSQDGAGMDGGGRSPQAAGRPPADQRG